MKFNVTILMKSQMFRLAKKNARRMGCSLAILLCSLSPLSCLAPERRKPDLGPAKDDLSVYRVMNNQAGHEHVKTEQFLVPVGSVIVINGLEFAPGAAKLTRRQELILQQVFNSLEEITENTVGDTNSTRVAEFKKMELEIRSYPDAASNREVDRALAEERAKAVLNFLAYLGTPSWRLKARGVENKNSLPSHRSGQERNQQGRVEFLRMR